MLGVTQGEGRVAGGKPSPAQIRHLGWGWGQKQERALHPGVSPKESGPGGLEIQWEGKLVLEMSPRAGSMRSLSSHQPNDQVLGSGQEIGDALSAPPGPGISSSWLCPDGGRPLPLRPPTATYSCTALCLRDPHSSTILCHPCTLTPSSMQ